MHVNQGPKDCVYQNLFFFEDVLSVSYIEVMGESWRYQRYTTYLANSEMCLPVCSCLLFVDDPN